MVSARAAIPGISRLVTLLLISACAWLLAACGGGKGEADDDSNARPAALSAPRNNNEAARFLTQATFGPDGASIERVNALGYAKWLDEQISKPASLNFVKDWLAQDVEIKKMGPQFGATSGEVMHSFWHGALAGDDQLRQRVAFALSEVFVVSWAEGCVSDNSRGLAGYYDTLLKNAFVDFRDLLGAVAFHPIMGCYLSHLRNQRENAATGRLPDENFAREVMQLFTIGLVQLKADGTPLTGSNGQALETYTTDDVTGLAKVFTGLSLDCPDWPSDSCFLWGEKDGVRNEARWDTAMALYPQYHSFATDKAFLRKYGGATGPAVVIAAQTRPDPASSLDTALDALAAHPNVGPFIGKQLIQRLVTSNPSAAYVERVTNAFNKRRNMGDMIKAILLDDEARDPARMSSEDAGKVREPILRLTAFLRAVGFKSNSGFYLIDTPYEPEKSLSQNPLNAPSVFNFFRPSYAPPAWRKSYPTLVAPELQITNESSVAAYVNFMQDVVQYGVGRNSWNWQAPDRDIQLSYAKDKTTVWWTHAAKPRAADLVDHINAQLFYGTMPAALRTEIIDAVETIAYPQQGNPSDNQIKLRLWSALSLALASPEFIVQR
jgi:uncharacterized protein (DUF1800 family)